jgi:hypothetical protein
MEPILYFSKRIPVSDCPGYRFPGWKYMEDPIDVCRPFA